jgi:hypothetical protein
MESVTIVTPTAGAADGYGNPAITTTTRVVSGVLVGFGATSEPALAGADPIASAMKLYFPAGTVITEGDSFLVRGDAYVKDGIAMAWTSRAGVAKGVVVGVRRHDG